MNDKTEQLEQALTVLGTEFPLLNWDFRPDPSSGRTELISQWLGDPADEIMLCAFTGSHIDERFHRQDFFFVNFAYRGNYEALSASSQNRISMKEGDCYIGQPYSGYALKKDGGETVVIVGILIKKETFLREYLSVLGADTDLLHFFLEPAVNRYADGIIRFTPGADSPIWSILDLMVLEYVRRTDQSQSILKALFLSMAMYMTEAVRAQNPVPKTVDYRRNPHLHRISFRHGDPQEYSRPLRLPSGLPLPPLVRKRRPHLFTDTPVHSHEKGGHSLTIDGSFHRKNCCHAGLQQ